MVGVLVSYVGDCGVVIGGFFDCSSVVSLVFLFVFLTSVWVIFCVNLVC